LGLVALAGAAASAPWRHSPEWWQFEELTTAIRHGLDQGMDPDDLVAQAERTLQQVEKFPSRSAEAHFLAGSAYYRQGQQTQPPLAKAVWARAVEQLEQAGVLGVAAKDEARLRYRLGYCLYQQGKDVPRALGLMAEAVEKGAEQPLQGYQLLVRANLERRPPNLDGALDASVRVLDLTA